MTTTSTLSGRDRAILRAVAAGGAQLQLGTEPDLFLDGRSCCDQTAAHHPVHAGLLARASRRKPPRECPGYQDGRIGHRASEAGSVTDGYGDEHGDDGRPDRGPHQAAFELLEQLLLALASSHIQPLR